jgi:hypothetical protein
LDHVVGVAGGAGDALSEVEKEAAIAVGDLLEGIGVVRPQAFHEASIVRRYRAAHADLLGRARLYRQAGEPGLGPSRNLTPVPVLQ